MVSRRHGPRCTGPGPCWSLGGLLQEAPKVRAINEILDDVGMTLIPSRPEAPPRVHDPELARKLAQLPRVVTLAPARDNPVPAVVDAWVALQTLRAAVTPSGNRKPAKSPLDQDDVEQIALEHLLVGSAIDGSPIGHSGGGLTANPDSNSGVTGPGSTDSYVYSGGDTRSPVALLLDPPHRRSAAECQDDYGRRPVVAVLDTGVRAHPWLDVERTSGSYNLNPAGNGDGFMSVDLGIQKAILDEGKKAEAKGDKPRQLIRHPWDTPITADPLVGELDSDSGHCTFISGIVRQIAPDARVLAVRIMHSDGAVYEGDLLCALRHLVIRIAQARGGSPGADGRRDLAVARLLRRDPARRDVHLRALGRHRAAARPGCHRGGGGRELLDQPQVLPRGVRHEDAARGRCR